MSAYLENGDSDIDRFRATTIRHTHPLMQLGTQWRFGAAVGRAERRLPTLEGAAALSSFGRCALTWIMHVALNITTHCGAIWQLVSADFLRI